MYKRLFSFLLAVIACFSCIVFSSYAAETSEKKQPALKVALVFSSIAELDDKSFVTAVTKGAQNAAQEFGISLRTLVQPHGTDDLQFITGVADSGVDVVVAVSYVNVGPLLEIAESHPNTKVLVIDGVVPPFYTNAKSIFFREHEGSFLVGMIAALKSKSDKIGFIGGRDITLIRNFAYGFRQGAEYVNPKIQIVENMIGTDVSSWDNPTKARELAKEQFAQGVDIIFSAAGASGLAVLDEAAKQDKLAIGVDSNQNGLFPGHVLTSMVKRVDIAVYQALEDLAKGNWDPGIMNLGLKEKAIDYAVDVNNKDLLDQNLINTVETAREQIINGSLNVKIYSPN